MDGAAGCAVAGAGFLAAALVDSFSLSTPQLSPLRLRYSLTSAFSLLFLLSSLIAFVSRPSSPIPLPSLAVSAVFLLYSLAGHLSLALPLPAALLDLVLSSSFLAQTTLLLLSPSNPDGIEHRYFQLLAIPALICALATVAVRSVPNARIVRAAALALQGTWLFQIGLSVFTEWVAHDCELHRRSAADYTVKCRTHEAYHRARAIAVLQFNCHLALLLIAGMVLYAVYAARVGPCRQGPAYRPLNKEIQMQGEGVSQFMLESDNEEEEDANAANVSAPKESVLNVAK